MLVRIAKSRLPKLLSDTTVHSQAYRKRHAYEKIKVVKSELSFLIESIRSHQIV